MKAVSSAWSVEILFVFVFVCVCLCHSRGPWKFCCVCFCLCVCLCHSRGPWKFCLGLFSLVCVRCGMAVVGGHGGAKTHKVERNGNKKKLTGH